MGCQKAIAEKIIKQKGDYVLALKGNQNNLYNEVKCFFDKVLSSDLRKVTHDFYEEQNTGHGRVEHCQCFAFSVNPEHIPSSAQWLGLKSIVMINSCRKLKDKITEDIRFYITSTEPNAKQTLHAVRQHWGIENSLHWTLDVTFREDESRIRKEASPENFAILRHIALNIIKSDTSIKASVKRKRLLAALKDDFRETLIQQVI